MKMFLLLCTFMLLCNAPMIDIVETVHFPVNPTPETLYDDKNWEHKRETKIKTEFDPVDTEKDKNKPDEEGKDQLYLQEALKDVLNPSIVIMKEADLLKQFKTRLLDIENENNKTLESFVNSMDELSLDVCAKSQEALWSYVNDADNEGKKKYMLNFVNEEEELKRRYWQLLKEQYRSDVDNATDPRLKRKFYRIHNRATNAQIPKSEERAEINEMQRIWTLATVCPYNVSSCNAENANLSLKDLDSIFANSNDTDELVYYWKSYRDATGRKIRPLFKNYVNKMNKFARSEGFQNMSDMWFSMYEDDNFSNTVQTLWDDIKPLYKTLHEYVRAKLKIYYKEAYQCDDRHIPAHLLGNLWAHEWQAVYSKVVPYPEHNLPRLISEINLKPKYLFDIVDEFHQSLGFESARESYVDVDELSNDSDCVPSSHDMCDGFNYRIRWCGDKVADVNVELIRAATLLGRVQYFKHYRNLSVIFRDAPNPAFLVALSDIFALQLTNPLHMKSLNFIEVDNSYEASINHLLWMALEKLPLIAYADVLDRWRWEVFNAEDESGTDGKWNQRWWELRKQETGIAAPVPRNESDLDPASKYHVASHVQYITYLISHVLEFQILLSLCKLSNNTGPLHECSIFGNKEAGARLSKAMSLGASEEWPVVLKVMTDENRLSAAGLLEYFLPLENFLKNETIRLDTLREQEMDQSAPIIVGIIIVLLTVTIITLYCVKKYNLGNRMSSFCAARRSRQNDRETSLQMQGETNETDGPIEPKG